MRMLLFLLLWPSIATAQASSVGYALPVGPGVPDRGPWQIKLWTTDDCASCVVPGEDRKTFERIRDALIADDPLAIVPYNSPVTIVSFKHGQTEHQTDLVLLRKILGHCRIGAQAPLKPNGNADLATSFGLGLDCDGNKQRQFVSLTIKDDKLRSVYFLPDELIQVSMSPR